MALMCLGVGTVSQSESAAQATGTITTIYMTNNTGATASCVQFTVDGTGGGLLVDPNLIYGGPFQPAVTVNQAGNQATVTLDWGQAAIANATSVSCILQSRGGPVTFVSGNWCSAVTSGGVVTPIGPVSIPLGSGAATAPGGNPWTGPGGGFGAPWPPLPLPGGGTCKLELETETRCKRFTGITIYTPWFIGPPRFAGRSFCWRRWCKTSTAKRQVRFRWKIVGYDSAGMPTGLKRRGKWTKWITVGIKFGDWKEKWTSIKPKDFVIPLPWPFPFLDLFFGPTKDLSPAFAKAGIGTTEYGRDLYDFVESDSAFVPTTDVATAFHRLSVVLVPQFGDDEPLPSPSSFKEYLQMNAESYAEGAKVMADLAAMMQRELVRTSPEEVHQIQKDVKQVSQYLAVISDSFKAGEAPSSNTLDKLSRVFGDLAAQFEKHARRTGSQGMIHAADSFKAAADNMDFARKQVETGLQTVGQRDDFMWPMFAGLTKNMDDVAAANVPHVRVNFKIKDYLRNSGTFQGARVEISTLDGKLLDVADLQVSDRWFVSVPLDEYADDKLLVASIKLPTILSASTLISGEFDGADIDLGNLEVGDADDDDCITRKDLEAVMVDAEMGAGGQHAKSVPATDIDGNGIVDKKDVGAVMDNLGLCGDGR